MNVFSKVTLESLKKNRTRTVVTIIGIMLSAAMICASTTFVSSMQNFVLRCEIYSSGDWHGAVYDAAYKDYEDIRDFVEDFTELGRQLKMPVKTYSSGMRARLAFALSLAIEFDCYLIDEVIMVGDQNFSRKCQHELFDKRADRSMILASHSTEMVRDLCNRAVILQGGHAEEYDDVGLAVDKYVDL